MTRTAWLTAALIVSAGSLTACSSGSDGPVRSTSPTTNSNAPKSISASQLAAVSSAAAAASSAAAREQAVPLPNHALRAKVSTSDGAITVYSVKYPYPPSAQAAEIKDRGVDFAVADIKFCPTSADADYSEFQLHAKSARAYTFWNVQIGAKSPNLTDVMFTPVPGQCVRGYLTFEVKHGEKLRTLSYVDSLGSATTWDLK